MSARHPYIQPKPKDGPTVCAVCGQPAYDEHHRPPYEQERPPWKKKRGMWNRKDSQKGKPK